MNKAISDAKAIYDGQSDQEKPKALFKLLQDQINKNKRLEILVAGARKTLANLQRDKEISLNEISHEREVKAKLEKLCKEIMAQNKEIAKKGEEIVQEEKSKTANVKETFKNALEDVRSKMEEAVKECEDISKENAE